MKAISSNPVLGAVIALLVISIFYAEPALAQGGVSALDTGLERIITILRGAGVAIITLAIMWCGYKVGWGGATIQDVAKPFLGAVLIGSASALASFFL